MHTTINTWLVDKLVAVCTMPARGASLGSTDFRYLLDAASQPQRSMMISVSKLPRKGGGASTFVHEHSGNKSGNILDAIAGVNAVEQEALMMCAERPFVVASVTVVCDVWLE